MNAFSGFGPAIAAGRSGYGAVSMAVASGRVQLVTIRQESLSLARWRLLWVALGFVFVTLLALVRIGYLGASDNGARGTSLEEALLPPRGEISDRNGVPLARAFPAYALWFNPTALGEDGAPLVRDPAVVAGKLSTLGRNNGQARERFTASRYEMSPASSPLTSRGSPGRWRWRYATTAGTYVPT